MEKIENTVKEIEQKESSTTGKENTEQSPTIPVSAYLDDFYAEILNKKRPAAIPTGFAKLDSLLGGGLFAGLYVLGASSSLGKTTLTCQIANQIAATEKDVLIFSLEMARQEIIAKDISRLSGLIPYCGSMPGQEALSTSADFKCGPCASDSGNQF